MALVTIFPMAKRQKVRVFFREWRKYRDLSQEQAAERMGFTQETVSRLERGKFDYTQESLEAMASAYGCDPQDLFLPPDRPRSELERVLESLGPRLQARALRIIQALKEDEAA